LYVDIFDRYVDSAALTNDVAGLENGSLTRLQLVQFLLQSHEFHTMEARNIIARVGGDYSSNSIPAYALEMDKGTTDEQIDVQTFETLPGYAPSTSNQNFISALYSDAFDRIASSVEIAGWLDKLQGGESRDAVVTAFFTSHEYHSIRVQGLYQYYMREAIDNSTLASLTALLDSGAPEEAATAQILTSADYPSQAIIPQQLGQVVVGSGGRSNPPPPNFL
jgi:hypothetical protein